jgi:hypothetical protein
MIERDRHPFTPIERKVAHEDGEIRRQEKTYPMIWIADSCYTPDYQSIGSPTYPTESEELGTQVRFLF